MPQYISKHFKIQELVPIAVYKARGEKAWELLDDRALRTLDELRSVFGKIVVNNWYWGGPRQWSGLRTEASPFGSQYSQHRFGRAFDCIFYETEVSFVRQFILDNPHSFREIRSVELETCWLHFDVRNCTPIKTYTP